MNQRMARSWTLDNTSGVCGTLHPRPLTHGVKDVALMSSVKALGMKK